ncbi:Universal stress protein A family protein [Penicillium cataractarum]|uniref:Universal stress protein A family protein n=1 Tax=Penicillium cataractarum TaxID=2100454 RepID=A0A9W9RY34_9EURO|nr:Universal stress protein A family protein [Penicillium cataractarum]KAJ5368402.1 Universal stress protein A family protein [Penicillium cataractarum]
MSAQSSPKPSFESDERPESSQSLTPPAVSGHRPSISFEANPRSQSPRRRSIQFNVGNAGMQLPSRTHNVKEKRLSYADAPVRDLDVEREPRALSTSRGPSPPPPKTYERGVSFNTFDNRDAADFSLTLNYKHKGYQSTRRSRTFLCGTDQNDYSDFALNWLIDELVVDGDEIVCLRAVEKDSRMASDAGIEEGKYRQEAKRLFEQVIQKNSQDEKAISLVLEVVVGKVEEIIQRMIRIHEPVMLIVGTRGRNLKGVHSLLPGSVSKYCVQHSPIPVIVVRPSPKREKKKKKRRADPGRRSYNQLLELSEKRGSRVFDGSSSTEGSALKLPGEEAAVAEALGLPATYSRNHSRSSLSVSDRSSLSIDESDPAYPVPYSLDSVLMRSPLSGSSASSEESVVVSEPRRSTSPEAPLRSHSPSLEQDSSDESENQGKEEDATDSISEASDATAKRMSIPVIEVSNESEEKGTATTD